MAAAAAATAAAAALPACKLCSNPNSSSASSPSSPSGRRTRRRRQRTSAVRVFASSSNGPEPKPTAPKVKQSFLEALDFSKVRSQEDAELIADASMATRLGEKMSRQQYAALRRKIGGTYRDFFKDSVDVDGEYVEEGWVDKRCYICKKDTASEPRTIDNYGRYAHASCMEKSKSGNFFTRLFGK